MPTAAEPPSSRWKKRLPVLVLGCLLAGCASPALYFYDILDHSIIHVLDRVLQLYTLVEGLFLIAMALVIDALFLRWQVYEKFRSVFGIICSVAIAVVVGLTAGNYVPDEKPPTVINHIQYVFVTPPEPDPKPEIKKVSFVEQIKPSCAKRDWIGHGWTLATQRDPDYAGALSCFRLAFDNRVCGAEWGIGNIAVYYLKQPEHRLEGISLMQAETLIGNPFDQKCQAEAKVRWAKVENQFETRLASASR